jgi:hypothetical protein
VENTHGKVVLWNRFAEPFKIVPLENRVTGDNYEKRSEESCDGSLRSCNRSAFASARCTEGGSRHRQYSGDSGEYNGGSRTATGTEG